MCVCTRAHVCVCWCAFVHGSMRAHPRVLLSPPQSALNWNSVLLWEEYEATAAHSSASCVKYEYRYTETEWKCGLIVCCGCPVGISLIEWLAWFDEIEGKRGLTLGVMLHSMQCLVHIICLTCFSPSLSPSLTLSVLFFRCSLCLSPRLVLPPPPPPPFFSCSLPPSLSLSDFFFLSLFDSQKGGGGLGGWGGGAF